LTDHVQGVAQETRILASGPHHQFTGTQAGQDGPGAVDRVDDPGLPFECLDKRLQGLDLVPPAGLLAVQHFQTSPIGRPIDAQQAGGRIGIVVHHPQEVRFKAPGKGQVSRSHCISRHVLKPEVMPEGEGRAVEALSCQGRSKAINSIEVHDLCVRSADPGSFGRRSPA
jgi:hypothetical protein